MSLLSSMDYDNEGSPLLENKASIQEDNESNSSGSGVIATFFNFAKASIGSGSFALPYAISVAGILVGSAGMILLGIISVYTMQLMLECKAVVMTRVPPKDRKDLTYTKIGQSALGFFGKWAVDLSVLGCNLGVCAGYMIFIASNLQWSFTCFAQHSHPHLCLNIFEMYALILPILVILTYLPSFKYLAYAAYVGAVFLAVAMITVFVFGFQHTDIFSPQSRQYDCGDDCLSLLPPSWYGIAQWFGVTAFLFCVHSMVIPLESSMKRPQYMSHVLDAACLVVVGINLPFALYGYYLFGDKTEGYIFMNMPGGTFNDIIRLFLSLELTLTFPLVLKPASEVAEEIMAGVLKFISYKFRIFWISQLLNNKERYWRVTWYVLVCVLRTFLVLISWGVAVAIPRFELCLAFVGSLATSVLAFVLPPLFHLVLKRKWVSLPRNILHGVILVVGVLATIGATTINLREAIINSSSGDTCTAIHTQCIQK